MVYIILISIITPLIMLLTITEDKSKYIIGFTIMGMLCAVLSYEINSFINYIYLKNDLEIRIFISPITEEIIKSIPILLVLVLSSSTKKYIISLSMSVGIGFAILENTYLLVVNGNYIDIWWALIRGFSTGIMHGIATSSIGFGCIFIKKKKLFYTGIFALLCLSITYHGIYNLLVESKYNYIGFMMPISTYLFYIYANKKLKSDHIIS